MKAEDLEQEFLDYINQAELIQSEDNLWTLGYRRPKDGEFRGCKDFFSMTSAMKYYHQSKLQALKQRLDDYKAHPIVKRRNGEEFKLYGFISIEQAKRTITNLEDK